MLLVRMPDKAKFLLSLSSSCLFALEASFLEWKLGYLPDAPAFAEVAAVC